MFKRWLDYLFRERESGLVIISAFDGIAIPLKILGKRIKRYYRSEIDKNANQVVQGNQDHQTYEGAEVIDLGDVRNITSRHCRAIVRLNNGVNSVIGGSPCQNLSSANRHSGVNGRSGLRGAKSHLFFHFPDLFSYVRAATDELLSKMESAPV
mmetsp:Transcript_65697/g.155186  ORF Transcript_65697/g.155186 Transcript_65697/m.155186 type:complete len:153 (+) Transcript_65697:296-754(+)